MKNLPPIIIAPYTKTADRDEIWKDFDADAAWDATKSMMGLWADMDAKHLSAEIRRWRREGTRRR